MWRNKKYFLGRVVLFFVNYNSKFFFNYIVKFFLIVLWNFILYHLYYVINMYLIIYKLYNMLTYYCMMLTYISTYILTIYKHSTDEKKNPLQNQYFLVSPKISKKNIFFLRFNSSNFTFFWLIINTANWLKNVFFFFKFS